MTQFLTRLWPEEEAQDLAEYALLLFLVCMTAVSAVSGLAAKVNSVYSTAGTHMAATVGSASLAGGSLSYSASGPNNPPLGSKDKKKP